MILLGETARHLRERQGLTQKEAARVLGITNIYLSQIENNKAFPSPALLAKYREAWGVDLYMLACCLFVDIETLPEPVRGPMRQLKAAWTKELGGSLPSTRGVTHRAEHN